MRKITLLFLFAANSLLAQSWCPQGATWKYSFYGFMTNGYNELHYAGDTLLQNVTCNRIEHRFKGSHYSAPNTMSDIHIGNYYTYESNQVVYVLSDTLFDTLYNFNAAVGDQWQIVRHPFGSSCWPSPRRTVQVTDTGHVIINSTWLKKLVLQYTLGYGMSAQTYHDTVYQTVGSIHHFLFPFHCEGLVIDPDFSDFLQPFRCYSDNGVLVAYAAPGIVDCNFIAGTAPAPALGGGVRVFPNPFSGMLIVENEEGAGQFRLNDVLGKTVWMQSLDRGTRSIDLAGLPAGIYSAVLQTPSGVFPMGRLLLSR